MRRFIAFLLIASFATVAALGQTPPIRFSDGKPQIAYHLFSTWADNYQINARRGKAVGESILFGAGALALGGAATTWYAGDDLSRQASGGPLDVSLKQNLTLGFGITGGALLLSGLIVNSVPVKDYRAIYADVFEERDSEVQEAMAVSVLRYQADRGKERRLTSFIMGFVVPLLAGGFRAGYNLAAGETWSKGVWDVMNYSSWTAASSIVSLFSKTDEERLYDRYLATRDALIHPGK